MPDVVGTGVIRLEVDKAGAQADIDVFIAQTDAKLKSAGASGGKSMGDGISSGANKGDVAVQKLNKDLDATKTKAESAGGKNKNEGMGLLLTSILAIGPALVPLGAVAAASVGALGVAAGTAVVAFKGIAAEMKAGTDEGKAYTAGIKTLSDDLSQLERTAASHLLAPFQEDVKILDSNMSLANGLVADFSDIIGKGSVSALDGLSNGLRITSPLILDLGQRADNVAAAFDKWTQNGGLQSFTDYAEKELPQVAKTVDELASATVKLVQGLGPLGGASLTGLRLLAELINALPVDKAQELETLLIIGFGIKKGTDLIQSGIKTYNDLATALDKVIAKKFALAGADAAEGSAAVAEGAEDIGGGAVKSGAGGLGALTSLTAASGPLLAITAGVAAVAVVGTLAWQSHAKAARDDQKAIDDLTQALEDNNGVLGDNGKTALESAPAFKDASGALKTLGISQDQLNAAATGNKAALDAVNKAVDENATKAAAAGSAGKGVTTVVTQQSLASAKLSTDLKKLTDDYNTSKAAADAHAKLLQTELAPAYKTTAEGVAELNSQYGIATATANKYVNALGITNDEVTKGTISIGKYDEALDVSITAENESNAAVSALFGALEQYSTSAGTAADKATLLGQILVSSQGDALSYAGAMADGYAATQNLIKGFDSAEKSAVNLKTGVIDFTKAGAGPLIQQLDQMQSSAEDAAKATYQHELATKGDNIALQDAQTVFENLTGGSLQANAKQLGLNKDQAKALADQYFKIPTNLTTEVQSVGLNNVNDTLTAIGNQLAYLTGHPFNIQANINIAAQIAAQTSSSSGKAGNHGTTSAQGNLFEYYASGGMHENHIAQIAPANTIRTWAEPETGGEAYIPLAPQKRARSTAIWRETGTRLGQSFADGGFSGGGYDMSDLVQAIHALASRPVSVVVDKREIARASNNGNLVLNRGRG